MNKKKIIKIVLLALFIILAVFLGIIIRRMIIISDITNKVSKYKDNNNHYEKIVTEYNGESKTTSEYYCKDKNAVMIVETTTKQSSEKKKLTQYFKGEKSNSYFDVGTTKIAVLNSNGVPSKIEIWGIDYNNSLWNLFYLALITPINTIEYNGKECYFLDSPELRHSYIEKETGLVLKAIDGKSENEPSSILEYEYNFDNVDDSIFIEPDIGQYTIQENQ